MPIKNPYTKKFWTWKKMVPLVIILAFVGANAYLLWPTSPPYESAGFPLDFSFPNQTIPSAHNSINRTAVSLFVNDTLRDYNAMLASKQET